MPPDAGLPIAEEGPPAEGHEELLIAPPAGPRLFEQSWLPDGAAKASVAVVHGLGEHSGRYAPLADELTRHGYAVHALDLRGHGRSEGERAYVTSFGAYLDDLQRFLARVRRPGEPLFVLGHSMGGTIVTLAAIARGIEAEGIVLSGPALPDGRQPSWLQRSVIRVLARVAPRTPLMRLDANLISRDPEVVERYLVDPLVYHGRLRAGFIAAFMRALARIGRDMERFDLPLLILHGSEDRLASPEGSRMLRSRAGSDDVTFKLYRGLYHEVLNEPERARVLKDVIEWLDAHVGEG
ncbi:MAG: alpha/beta hydrolase [Dehalococcoidia bacterium]